MLPEESGRNGIIIGYTVSCTDAFDTSSNTITTIELSATRIGLTPYRTYTCSVTASNSAGNSPEATLNFTTAAARKWCFFFQNRQIL